MSYFAYQELRLNDLHEMSVVIQSVDMSFIHPIGVVEDVLVQVNELIFPIDFYILKMDETNSTYSTSIQLGRPFMKIAKTWIDLDSGILSVKFGREIVKFNIFDVM